MVALSGRRHSSYVCSAEQHRLARLVSRPPHRTSSDSLSPRTKANNNFAERILHEGISPKAAMMRREYVAKVVSLDDCLCALIAARKECSGLNQLGADIVGVGGRIAARRLHLLEKRPSAAPACPVHAEPLHLETHSLWLPATRTSAAIALTAAGSGARRVGTQTKEVALRVLVPAGWGAGRLGAGEAHSEQ